MLNTTDVLTDIQIPGLKLFKEGKVRSVFSFDDTLVIVASDRVSAFDSVLPQGIPQKGQLLTEMAEFWFNKTKHIVPNHLLSCSVDKFPAACKPYANQLSSRSMWVKKTDLIEIECVVRGYLIGTGWKDYQQTGSVCGIILPQGLRLAEKLPEPIFTPASKAQTGHDENISYEEVENRIGIDLALQLKTISLELYHYACEYAAKRGIIIADTKFEFGLLEGHLYLIDEALTPDSSRFWPMDKYQVGQSPESFDKQIIRDYLDSTNWDKNPPAPELPQEVIEKTASKYKKIKDLLTT